MRSTLMALLALPLFALVACGGGVDDDVDQSEDTGTEEVEVEEPSTFDGDIDNDGVEDGYYDPVVQYGNRVYLHETIIDFAEVYVVGYGFTTFEDWSTLSHAARRYTIRGSEGDFYGYSFDDHEGDAYRVNFTWQGSSGADGFSNWADLEDLASGDVLVWQNPDGTKSLCFTIANNVVVAPGPSTCDHTYPGPQ